MQVVHGHTLSGSELGVSALKFNELRLLVSVHLALETGLFVERSQKDELWHSQERTGDRKCLALGEFL